MNPAPDYATLKQRVEVFLNFNPDGKGSSLVRDLHAALNAAGLPSLGEETYHYKMHAERPERFTVSKDGCDYFDVILVRGAKPIHEFARRLCERLDAGRAAENGVPSPGDAGLRTGLEKMEAEMKGRSGDFNEGLVPAHLVASRITALLNPTKAQ